MTGEALAAALREKLGDALPEIEVRAAYAGKMERKPAKPVLCIGLLSEERTDGAGSAKLGVWLYTPPETAPANLFSAVCAALQAIPCTVRSVTRGEPKYDGALGCVVTPCTILAAVSMEEKSRTAVKLNGVPYTADIVSVSVETQAKRYGSVGEDVPHTVVSGAKLYRVALVGLDGGEDVLGLENFTLEAAGVRYAPCAWRKIERDRLVLEAGGAETITESGETV